jgi:hypothetical protein
MYRKKSMYQPKYAIEASATMSSYEVTGLVVSAVTSAVTSGRDLQKKVLPGPRNRNKTSQLSSLILRKRLIG